MATRFSRFGLLYKNIIVLCFVTIMIRHPYIATAFLIIFFLFQGAKAFADEKVLTLYHDADWINHKESSLSILQGIQTALSEVGSIVQGYKIQIVKKNHGGNILRSLNNFKSFLQDPTGLAVFSGIHSPPLIKNREFINTNKALTLVPWAAGSPITRYPSEENWVFRLSIDDSKAGPFMINYATGKKSCRKPFLLLEDTPWGDSNLKSMTKSLKQRNMKPAGIIRFDWNLRVFTGMSYFEDIKKSKADCVMLVSNVPEGAVIIKAMKKMGKEHNLPVISHWGITGGNFHKKVAKEERAEIDLSFIQTCFSFIKNPLSKKGKAVLESAKKLFPNEVETAYDIKSPVGFIHGYDLTKLLLTAINRIKIDPDMTVTRDRIRLALENIETPVEGLLKTYQRPFIKFSPKNSDAHEALSAQEYCMAKFGEKNEILIQ